MMPLLKRRMQTICGIFLASLIVQTPPPAQAQSAQPQTVLGIEGTRFTINDRPTFLLGISYYAGLGASQESIAQDLDDLHKHGFNWLRLWATWDAYGQDVSAVDAAGNPRSPQFEKLKWLVAECDRRGLIVDVTLTRGEITEETAGRIPNLAAHQQAVTTIIDALKPHRNWYLDLANERDVGDARFVGIKELKTLREQARKLNPQLLVTASFGGHDLSNDDIREALIEAQLDFLAPHRPRHSESPGQTETQTREVLSLLKELGHPAPVLYQEPFRRGYTNWQPTAEDFLSDLRGAVQGGAAGWCLHNGSQRDDSEERPRRSFDLRAQRLFDQLDKEELKAVNAASAVVAESESVSH